MSKPSSDLYEGPITELVGDPDKDKMTSDSGVPGYPQRTGNGCGNILYDNLTGHAPEKGKG